MEGISSKASGRLENKYKFNDGTELNSDFDINFYETTFRSLDPQIGRFWQIDPLSTFIFNRSPYSFANNDPISRNDPLGLQDSTHKETSTPENPKYLGAVVVTTKIRPSFDASDVVRTILALSSSGNGSQPENEMAVVKVYSTFIDGLSDGMPNPPVIGGQPWMHKQWRIDLARDFVRCSIESILMFLPGLDAMVFEEEAILLLTEHGVISRKTATELFAERVADEGRKNVIKGFTRHAASQAVGRGFKTSDILKIVNEGNPVQAMGRYGPQTRYTLGGNTVVLNAEGKVVTVFSNAPGTANGLGEGFFIPFK